MKLTSVTVISSPLGIHGVLNCRRYAVVKVKGRIYFPVEIPAVATFVFWAGLTGALETNLQDATCNRQQDHQDAREQLPAVEAEASQVSKFFHDSVLPFFCSFTPFDARAAHELQQARWSASTRASSHALTHSEHFIHSFSALASSYRKALLHCSCSRRGLVPRIDGRGAGPRESASIPHVSGDARPTDARDVHGVAAIADVGFRGWPDGTVQCVDEGDAYAWMSDDYWLIEAADEETALAVADERDRLASKERR